MDSRFGRRNPEKAAQIDAKNQATLDAGERELAGLRERTGLQTTVSPDQNKDLPTLPHQPNWTYHPNAPNQNMTALPEMRDNPGYVAPHGTAIEPDSYYPDSQHPAYRDTDATSYEPAPYDYSNTSSSTGGDDRRGFRKLIKRRPLK